MLFDLKMPIHKGCQGKSNDKSDNTKPKNKILFSFAHFFPPYFLICLHLSLSYDLLSFQLTIGFYTVDTLSLVSHTQPNNLFYPTTALNRPKMKREPT